MDRHIPQDVAGQIPNRYGVNHSELNFVKEIRNRGASEKIAVDEINRDTVTDNKVIGEGCANASDHG